MPHSESALVNFGKEGLAASVPREKDSDQSFLQTFTGIVQRLLGYRQPSSAASNEDKDGGERCVDSSHYQILHPTLQYPVTSTAKLEALSIRSGGPQQPVVLSPVAKSMVSSAAQSIVSAVVEHQPRRDALVLPIPERFAQRDDSGEPLVTVSRLDAQTAPLVATIGGRLLNNTLSMMFASPMLLAQCFLSSSPNAPLGMDMAAAVTFFSSTRESADHWVELSDGISEIELRLRRDVRGGSKSALARATAVIALHLSMQSRTSESKDASVLMARVTRLVVGLAYPDVAAASSSGSVHGWYSRFVHDSNMRQQWIAWWARVPAIVARQWGSVLLADALSSVERLLSGLTSDLAIASRLAGGDNALKWVGALELLRLISDANDCLCNFQLDFGARLPWLGEDDSIEPSEFYSPAILKHFGLERELLRWIDNMRFRLGPAHGWHYLRDKWAEENIISPFMYPFLFDLDAKMRLLVIEVHGRMAQRYLSAHDRQAELVQHQRMLNIDAYAEQQVRQDDAPEWPLLTSSRLAVSNAGSPYLVLSVRRSQLMQDVMDSLLGDKAGMSRARFPLKVRFVESGEDGVDMGGVQKEMFALVLPLLLAPERGLFVHADDSDGGYLWPNAASDCPLSEFEAVGTLLGVAFANGVSLDSATAPLAPLLVSQLAFGSHSTAKLPLDALLTRVEGSFPALVSGLRSLLDWDEPTQGRIEDVFCRAFEISTAGLGTVPLVANGASIEVTGANRQHYVRRYLEYVGYEQAQAQTTALRRGFARAADGIVFRMVRASELVKWLCVDSDQTIDVSELERVATYDDEYTAEHEVVRRFWSVVRSLSQAHLRNLLGFVTASNRLPLGGYDNITFVVQRNGPDSDRLPTALTCFGRLLLPAYEDGEKMRQRLLTAIENSSGFGLV
ncbi:hypothetical protein EV174_003058 [Coemansia sp. RSA 2320]|nr:hypothetical protein EV174_003058 [Coemansia sp. RSA 2320]